MSSSLFAPTALLPDGWADNVLVTIDDDGCIDSIGTNCVEPPAGARRLNGALVPGIGNCHSHAFQRAMVGLAETRGSAVDDFWSWRDLMYRLSARVTPDHVIAIAAQLYVEMMKAGYTGVGEFHYLHHAPGGVAYSDPAQMSHSVVEAAAETGIYLTLLPVLYSYSDFGRQPVEPHQARFAHDLESFVSLLDALAGAYRNKRGVRLGLAFHSLRAVDDGQLSSAESLCDSLGAFGPIHIHIAEQQREVDACLQHQGCRPVEWLFDHVNVNHRWCLVHATHLSDAECDGLARSGAVVGLCPTTEANLGDGIFPATRYQGLGGAYAIGSDSHVCIDPAQELRLLEYGQRLLLNRRVTLTDEECRSNGASLLRRVLPGGARALGIESGAIAPGCRADLLVLDTADPVMYGKCGDGLLDAWIFASQGRVVKDVMVGGEWRILDWRHAREEAIRRRFLAVIDELALSD